MSNQVTNADLQRRSITELHVMQHQVQCALAQTKPGTDAHREAVASLDAIRRIIRLKQQALAPRF